MWLPLFTSHRQPHHSARKTAAATTTTVRPYDYDRLSDSSDSEHSYELSDDIPPAFSDRIDPAHGFDGYDFKDAARPRWRQRFSQPSVALMIIAACCGLANTCFLLSLRPTSTPKEMSRLLGQLGALIGLSVIFISAHFWVAALAKHIPASFRWYSHALQLINIGVWFAYDHGNSLDKHGAYNILIFNLILVPINFAIAFFMLWYRSAAGPADARRPRRFWLQFVATCLALWFAVTEIAKTKEGNLNLGFFGRQMPAAPTVDGITVGPDSCAWEGATPWFDLIPFRLNFFTGPMTCPPEESFQASLSPDGELVVDCNAEQTVVRSDMDPDKFRVFDGAAYSVLPRTEYWGLRLKHDGLTAEHNDLQRHVITYAEEHTNAYTGPVRLNEGDAAVMVRCGTAQPKIVYRIVPSHQNTDTTNKRLTEPPRDGLNVMVLFMDAVSRPQFHRRLPETRRVIEELTGSPDSASSLFELTRYHTVGLNTKPNTRALWAGLTTPGENAPVDAPEDYRAPIWEQFESAGYTVARVNPMCQDWVTYYDAGHLSTNGSEENLEQARISHEHLAWSCFPPYLPVGPHFAGNFAGSTSIKARCFSGTHVSWHELDWSEQFVQTYSASESARAFFLLATFMEGHEGSGEVLRTLDDRLARFLSPETGSIDYNNTAILLVSDHGALMGLNYAFLENGKVEASNPFAAMILPNRYLADGRGERMQQAEAKLVTGFDIYETVRGLMGEERASGFRSARVDNQQADGHVRRVPTGGFDLLEADPGVRSCEEAGVPESACRCR